MIEESSVVLWDLMVSDVVLTLGIKKVLSLKPVHSRPFCTIELSDIFERMGQ